MGEKGLLGEKGLVLDESLSLTAVLPTSSRTCVHVCIAIHLQCQKIYVTAMSGVMRAWEFFFS